MIGSGVVGMLIPDRHKEKWKTVVDLLGKVRSHDEIVRDLEHVDDPATWRLHEHVKSIASLVESEPHRRNFRKPAELALWIFCFDTAYRDQGLQLLDRVLEDGLLREAVDAELAEDRSRFRWPAAWAINVVQDDEMREDLHIDHERAEEILAADTHEEVLAA